MNKRYVEFTQLICSLMFTMILSACSASELFRLPDSPSTTYEPLSIPEIMMGHVVTPSPIKPSDTSTSFPSNTPTITPTSTVTNTCTPSPTTTASPTPTPNLNIMFQTCDMGIDLLNNMGEVTNAYITVQNIGQRDVSDIHMNLSANDEQKPYTKQSFSVKSLPSNYEITVKLTVDTDSKVATILTFILDAEPGVHETISKENCINRIPDFERINSLGSLFKVIPIH